MNNYRKFTSTELRNPPEPVFMNGSSEETSLVCKCGGEQVILKAIEDGPEYHECKDCGRTWYAA